VKFTKQFILDSLGIIIIKSPKFDQFLTIWNNRTKKSLEKQKG